VFPNKQLLLTLFLAMAALFALAGCGDDPARIEPMANIDSYLADLPTWEEFSPPQPNANLQAGDPVEEQLSNAGRDYNCTTTSYNLTQTPEEIVTFNPDSEILWLGALLQGDGYVGGIGSLQELPIRQRASLTVSIDLLTGENTKTVKDPTGASVNSALGELIQAATDAGHIAGSSIFFDQKETHDLRQSALDLGFSARYMGASVSGRLEYDQSFEEHTLTAYFIQRMFTTSVVLPQQPRDFFSSDFTKAHLQAQADQGRIGPDNLPTFISNIAWGRLMMLTMTSTHSVERMRQALAASYESLGGDGGGGTVDADDLTVLSESEMQVVTVGGDAESALALLRSGNLGNFFTSDAPLTAARPISYTVRNLADNTIAKVSETTNYNIRECSLIPQTPTGGQYTVKLEGLRMIELGCDGIFTPTPEVYYSFYVGTPSGLGSPVASRGSNNAILMEENVFHNLNASTRTVNLYNDGRGNFRLYGDAYDYDSGSADEQIGHWDHTYNATNVPVGVNRVWTKSGGGCTIRLYATITRVGDLYD